MDDDLLSSLLQFKSNMEYRNVHFNANKVKQYEAVREAMARKYSSIDVEMFAPNLAGPRWARQLTPGWLASCNTELNFTSANRATMVNQASPVYY